MSNFEFLEDVVGINDEGAYCHPYKHTVRGQKGKFSYSFEAHNRDFIPASAEELIALIENGRFDLQGKIRMVPADSTDTKKNGAMRVAFYKGHKPPFASMKPVSTIRGSTDSTEQYWWVNHKQTHLDEYAGGYIWSPKAKRNGGVNETYQNLTKARVGDKIISYAEGVVKAIGVVTKGFAEAPIPKTHWDAADYWSQSGWEVLVEWLPLPTWVRPKNFIDRIAPMLPGKYSPLQQNGDGNQGCYLAAISPELGRLILELAVEVDSSASQLAHELEVEGKEAIETDSLAAADLTETEKEQLTRARVGQGIFRQRVVQVEKRCRLTGVDNLAFLVASHIKPWRDCTNEERLSGDNGLLLSPHVDRLFDRGWISFTNEGTLLVASGAVAVVAAWRLPQEALGGKFNSVQRKFLEHHRKHIFQS
ncbi:HNH endonuclease [Pseudomonas sp. NPDC089396]|uniref:HNH endonuclease n=1 Tax=Pseudomonas sp. NPDC089396 TaxID=3364461 RepID=UPI003834D518